MPSYSEKQVNYFKLVKSYVDGEISGFFKKWKELYPEKNNPPRSYIEKIKKTAKEINYADLEDMASGVIGDEFLGDDKEIKVGYYVFFETKYVKNNEVLTGKFISKIKSINNSSKVIQINKNEFYNRFGVKIEPVRAANAANYNSPYVESVLFQNILKTSKKIADIVEKRGDIKEIRKIIQEVFSDL